MGTLVLLPKRRTPRRPGLHRIKRGGPRWVAVVVRHQGNERQEGPRPYSMGHRPRNDSTLRYIPHGDGAGRLLRMQLEPLSFAAGFIRPVSPPIRS